MTKYVALSMVAPNGENIASGRKTLEVRSWLPPVELPLRDMLIVENDTYLKESGEFDLNGRAVALVDVMFAEPWRPSQVEQACSSGWLEGYYAWHLANVRELKGRVRVCAKRGLYEVTLEEELASAAG